MTPSEILDSKFFTKIIKEVLSEQFNISIIRESVTGDGTTLLHLSVDPRIALDVCNDAIILIYKEGDVMHYDEWTFLDMLELGEKIEKML